MGTVKRMTTVLQNVVFPASLDPDVLPLYLDPEDWADIDGLPVRVSQKTGSNNVLSRGSSRVHAGERVSYGTYFNAFPASYWQRWTVVEEITLRVRLSGEGKLVIYRSNPSGQQQRVTVVTISGDEVEHEVNLPLDKFGDGGWYWFDLVAGERDLVLHGGCWETAAAPVIEGKLSLGMCTFNKADYCVRTLQNIAADEHLRAVIDRIFLVDQGTEKVQSQLSFPQLEEQFGEQLQVINQANLGGSGGYSRAMAEVLKRDQSEFLLLLDDDIEFETESALRALQFGRFSRDPVIVGGHMFDLFDKPVIHAWAEIVKPEAFVWGPSFEEQHRHDFRRTNLRQTPWMHARLDSDYNGWWMCMIPKSVIKEIGLSLPVFIKWDDAEYGLRALEAGYRTVSMPGVALWHMSWVDKDDSQDWQAYFHTRNRLIAGLIHSSYKKSGKLLQNNGRQDIKKLLNMQYYATQLSVNAMRDVLAGPEHLHKTIADVMPAARALAANFPETKVHRGAEVGAIQARGGRALPRVITRRDLDPNTERGSRSPRGAHLAIFTALNLMKQWRRADASTATPELEYSKLDAKWWTIPQHSSVVVGSADGAGKMVYRHNPEHFKRLLKESRQLTKQLTQDWDRLANEYRAAAPHLTSPEMWWKTFEA